MTNGSHDAGEAGVYPGKGSFRGLVAQLTSELGERLLQEHEARVSVLAREIDWLASEVSSLRGASRALCFQLGDRSNGICSESEALTLRGSGGKRRSSSSEGSERARERQFEAFGLRGSSGKRASSSGDSEDRFAERQHEVLPLRSCFSKGRSSSGDLDERNYEASYSSSWANPWVEQQQNGISCSALGMPQDVGRRGHVGDGADSSLQRQFEAPSACSSEEPRGSWLDGLLRRRGSRESTGRSVEEPRGTRQESLLLRRGGSRESTGRPADRRGLSRESSCRSSEAEMALTNGSSRPQTSPISAPLYKPSLQPQVDFEAGGEIPDPPPDPHEGWGSGGMEEGEEERLPSRSRRVSITCETVDELGEQIFEPGASSPTGSERLTKGSPLRRASTVVEEDLFEIRGPWVLTEETIQRMRTKSSMLVVVADDQYETGTGSIVSHLGRFVKTISIDLMAEWSDSGRFIVHPQSMQRVAWDILTILLVAWDFIMVPLLLFFDPPSSSIVDHIDFGTHVFWTLDIPATFMTGTFEGSRLIMRPCAIARRYLKSWFLIDLIIVVPEWVTVAFEKEGSVTTSFSALKGLKVIRVLRLLRLLKLDQTLREFQVLVNSNYLTITLGLLKLVVGLVFLNHFVACCWYAIGNSSSEGWVNFIIGEESNRTGQDPTLVYMYLMALHWSFTQFHSGMELVPTNWQERLFAVVVVLFALMCISSVLSSMTDMVIELQTLRRDEVKKERILRKYLWEHQISMQLSVRVKKYLQTWVDYRQKKESEYELFKVLPERLLTDLHDEARSPVLVAHSLFADVRNLNTRACRHICHACIEELAASASETLFTVGDACTRMLFVESGDYTYRKKRMSLGRLEDEDGARPCDLPVTAGSWVSEAALWTAWTNFGDFNCVTPGILLALDANTFATVVHQYEETWMQVALYARRFVKYINSNQCGDLIVSIDHDRRPTRRFSTVDL